VVDLSLKLRSLAVTAVALATSLFVGCSKDSAPVLNYEQPVSSLQAAFNADDEISYLSCFLPQQKAGYMAAQDYSDDFIEEKMSDDEIISKVRFKITDSTELADDEITALEQEAQQVCGYHFDFTKARRLQVNILAETRSRKLCDSRELTVVRYENIWYIYGDVIDSFSFETVTD
jgi:hypothetical protein